MEKDKMVKNDIEKKEMLQEHFSYEVMMLWDCYRLIITCNLIGNLLHTNIWSLLLEGLLLHARNLDEFLFYKFKKNGKLKVYDDACAEQFVKPDVSWSLIRPNIIPLSVEDFRNRVSKQLAHLTYKRMMGNIPEKSYNYVEITSFYLNVSQLFLNNIEEKYFDENLNNLLNFLNTPKPILKFKGNNTNI